MSFKDFSSEDERKENERQETLEEAAEILIALRTLLDENPLDHALLEWIAYEEHRMSEALGITTGVTFHIYCVAGGRSRNLRVKERVLELYDKTAWDYRGKAEKLYEYRTEMKLHGFDDD